MPRKKWYNVYIFRLTPEMRQQIIMDGYKWNIHLTPEGYGTIAALPEATTWLDNHMLGLFGHLPVMECVGRVNRQ